MQRRNFKKKRKEKEKNKQNRKTIFNYLLDKKRKIKERNFKSICSMVDENLRVIEKKRMLNAGREK